MRCSSMVPKADLGIPRTDSVEECYSTRALEARRVRVASKTGAYLGDPMRMRTHVVLMVQNGG